MKATRVVWCVALLLAAGVAVGLSQPQEWSSDDPFNGTWRINIEKSKKLAAGRASVPVYEVITFDIKDNMQTYRVEVQSRDDTPRRNMGYESAWNDGKYVPYTNYTSGEIIGYVTNVKVDDRTHYRADRDHDFIWGHVVVAYEATGRRAR